MDQRFDLYTFNTSVMSLDQFIKFYKDFNIFPALISINKIRLIFTALTQQYSQSQNTNKSKLDCIDKSIFNQSLLLISYSLKTNKKSQDSVPIKLTSLLELMSKSDREKEITQ